MTRELMETYQVTPLIVDAAFPEGAQPRKLFYEDSCAVGLP